MTPRLHARQCLVCREPFEATGKRRLCGKPVCYRVRSLEYRQRREIRDLRRRAVFRCRFCTQLAEAGTEYCETHQYLKEPCLQCGVGKRRRPPRAGRPPLYCEACRNRTPAKEA